LEKKKHKNRLQTKENTLSKREKTSPLSSRGKNQKTEGGFLKPLRKTLRNHSTRNPEKEAGKVRSKRQPNAPPNGKGNPDPNGFWESIKTKKRKRSQTPKGTKGRESDPSWPKDLEKVARPPKVGGKR